jgi:hypothetical protein
MTIALADPATTEVHELVAAAYTQWTESLEGSDVAPDVASRVLELVAEAHDQPLCVVWGRLCSTPHDLTLRSCCQTWVCDEHAENHDGPGGCKEFEAQLREERL